MPHGSFALLAAVASLLLLLLASPTHAAAPADKSLAIAGSIDADPAVLPYIHLHVVDSRTGAIVRSTPADGMGAFAVSGLPPTVKEVRAVVQAPDNQYVVDEAASVLSAPVEAASGMLSLKVVVKPAGEAAATEVTAPAQRLIAGATTLAVLLVLWYCRHLLVKALDFKAAKPPKQRKMMVMSR